MAQQTNPAISWRRLIALCRKETKQIVRDPSSSLIAFVIPLMLLFIFGYGINLDSSRLRVGILLEQQSEAARDLASTFAASPYIDATISQDRQALVQRMQEGIIRGLITIPSDFAQQLARPGATAPLQVITDGSEPNTANFVQGYAKGVWQVWQQQRATAHAANSPSRSRCNCATGLIPPPSVDILSSPVPLPSS